MACKRVVAAGESDLKADEAGEAKIGGQGGQWTSKEQVDVLCLDGRPGASWGYAQRVFVLLVVWFLECVWAKGRDRRPGSIGECGASGLPGS